jgi:transposase-like protein
VSLLHRQVKGASRMSKDDVLFGYRLQLFDLAGRTSVSHACRTFGIHRSTYDRWKAQVDRQGLEVLRPRERRRPRMPNQLPAMVEERIVAFAIAHPGAWSQAGRVRAGPVQVGRDRRLPQRCLAGAASMPVDLQETRLPGVGSKFTLRLDAGGRLAIILHNDGKRELYFFTRLLRSRTPPACQQCIRIAIGS